MDLIHMLYVCEFSVGEWSTKANAFFPIHLHILFMWFAYGCTFFSMFFEINK